MLFRVVYTYNWGEVLNGSETENEVEILSPITENGVTWFTHGEGSMGRGGGGLPIAKDWKWGGWRESCLTIKQSLFSRKTCGFTVPVNWHIVITSTIYSLEILIPSDCGLRACWEFFGTQNKRNYPLITCTKTRIALCWRFFQTEGLFPGHIALLMMLCNMNKKNNSNQTK